MTQREVQLQPAIALRPGSTIALIAPSGPFDVKAFERARGRLAERYTVRYGEDIEARDGFLAGDDHRRARELMGALEDPAVEGIIPVRGGYGAGRLLSSLPLELIREGRKLLVGFSDITAIHAAWWRAGVRSIHGTMVAGIAKLSDAQFERWVAAVEGGGQWQLRGLEALGTGTASGPLAGGNLAVLTALIGTPFAPRLDGAILFLEDVGEPPYRVDRMLTTLLQSQALVGIKGVVIGAFTNADVGAYGRTVAEVIEERLGSLGVPILMGVPAGHIDDNLELPLGAPVYMDAAGGDLLALEPAAMTKSQDPAETKVS